MRSARLLTADTAARSSAPTPRFKSLIWPAIERKRAAVSSVRLSTTARALRSVGALATLEKALSMSLTAAPNPLSPP